MQHAQGRDTQAVNASGSGRSGPTGPAVDPGQATKAVPVGADLDPTAWPFPQWKNGKMVKARMPTKQERLATVEPAPF